MKSFLGNQKPLQPLESISLPGKDAATIHASSDSNRALLFSKELAKGANPEQDITNLGMILLRHSIVANPNEILRPDYYVQGLLENIQKPMYLEMIKQTPNFFESFLGLIEGYQNQSQLLEIFNRIIQIKGITTYQSPLSPRYLIMKALKLSIACFEEDLPREDIFEYLRACLFKEDAMIYFQKRHFNPYNFFDKHLNEVHGLDLDNSKNFEFGTWLMDYYCSLIESLEADGFDVIYEDDDLSKSKQNKSIFMSGPAEIASLILIDSDSLNCYADDFESALQLRFQENMGYESRYTLTTEDVLETLQLFVNSLFGEIKNPPSNEQLKRVQEESKKTQTYVDKQGNQHSLVPLSIFVDAKTGVCLHRSLFDTYLLSEIIRRGYLDASVFMAYNETHAWGNLAVADHSKYGAGNYIIDTYNGVTTKVDESQILENPDNYFHDLYGFKHLYNMLEKTAEPIKSGKTVAKKHKGVGQKGG